MSPQNYKLGKILILVENLSVPFDRRVWLESRTLRDAGFQVSVICPRDPEQKSYEVIEDVAIYRYRPPPATDGFWSYVIEFSYCLFMTYILSLKALWQRGFDAIHACNPPDTFFLIGLFYKALGKKFVFDQHDLCPEVYLSRFGAGEKNLLYKALRSLEWLTYKTADMVIATNEAYRQIALERGNCSPDKVFVVRTGPDDERFCSTRAEPKLKKGLRYLVVYLGVMGPQDGVDYLLRAIHVIVNERKRKDIYFALIGKGDAKPSLVDYSQELGITKWVHFAGRIPDKELRSYLATATVCASPDPSNPLNDKSTMNKVMEYMAMGRAQVAFDLPGARESAGDAALYAKPNSEVDFAEKLLFLIDHREERLRLEKIALERVEKKLHWKHQRENLVKAYRTLF